jgi:hypothetical protein
LDIVVLLPPSGLSIVVADLVQRLCTCAGYGYASLRLADAPTGAADRRMVYHIRFPGPATMEAILAGKVRPISLLLDPLDAVLYIARTEKREIPVALRRQTAAHIAHTVTWSVGGHVALSLPPETPVGSLIVTLAHALGIDIDRAMYDAVTAAAKLDGNLPIDTVVAAKVPAHGELRREPPPVMPDLGRAIVDVLGSMCARPASTGVEIVWPRATFLSADVGGGQAAPETLQLLGPARNLFYGPYFHLPTGTYDATLTMAFEGRMEDVEFSIDVDTGTGLLGRFTIGARNSGLYRAHLDFTVTDSTRPIELRIRNDRGSIEGTVSLYGARLVRRQG